MVMVLKVTALGAAVVHGVTYVAADSALDLYTNGEPFVLRSQFQSNLCLDDGGGTVDDGSVGLKLNYCDGSLTQQFKINQQTHELERVATPGLCVALGMATTYTMCGGTNAATFLYSTTTAQIQWVADRSSSFCIDGAAIVTPWLPNEYPAYVMVCDEIDFGQKFLPQTPDAAVVLSIFTVGTEFTLCQESDTTRCLSDGGAQDTTDPGSRLVMATTVTASYTAATHFVYDATSHQIKSASKRGLCIEAKRTTQWLLSACDATGDNADQQFTYSEFTHAITLLANGGDCLDVQSDGTAATAECDFSKTTTQRFVLTDAASSPPASVTQASTSPTTAVDLYNSGEPFLLRSLYRAGLCLDDNGGPANGGSVKIKLNQCTGGPTQQFVRRLPTGEIQSASQRDLCLNPEMVYVPCSSAWPVTYIAATSQLHWVSTYPDMSCIADASTAPLQPDDRSSYLATCNADDIRQGFEVLPPTASLLPVLFQTGTSLAICSKANTSECLGESNGHVTMMPLTNDRSSSMTFTYIRATQQITSASKPWLCLQADATTAWTLTPCNAIGADAAQKFVYSEFTELLSPWAARDLCLDTANGKTAGDGSVASAPCRYEDDVGQQVVLTAPIGPLAAPVAAAVPTMAARAVSDAPAPARNLCQ